MLSTDVIQSRVRERLSQQRVVVERLLRLREQLHGSLFVRYGVCGKAACVCRTGRKHGPYFVLSTRSGGKGAFAYLDRNQARRARDLVARHRQYRSGMRRLRKVNAELVALLKRYQEATARRGGRRLGATAAAL
jgi:hypothetical protein